MRCKGSKILSYDINKEAQKTFKDLAIENKVEDFIQIESYFHPSMLKAYKHIKSLLICDVEGDEKTLLDINSYSELKKIDILFESHECLSSGITKELINRFSPSHKISLIYDDGLRKLHNAPKWFLKLENLDQLLATWEWRSGPTPWMFMQVLKPN